MTGMQEQWQKISENLRGVLNPGIFKVWIHPLDAHIEGNSLCLAAPSEYVARWLRDRMQDTLRSAAAPVLQVAPENIDIRISCQGGCCRSCRARCSCRRCCPSCRACGAACA